MNTTTITFYHYTSFTAKQANLMKTIDAQGVMPVAELKKQDERSYRWLFAAGLLTQSAACECPKVDDCTHVHNVWLTNAGTALLATEGTPRLSNKAYRDIYFSKPQPVAEVVTVVAEVVAGGKKAKKRKALAAQPTA